ncbi:MAG: ribosome assembly RNA-binding protein YhbY [Clostridia bacterium]|nr:ribosome assembly RNA-binding protein YhbY [Clostridia bacterium]
MLTSKQRAYLRGLGSKLDPIFQIGKDGVSEEICHQLLNALEARELIKVRVLETSPDPVKEAAEEIARVIGADVVQVIGTKFVLYKQSSKEEKRKIDLKAVR